MSATACVPMTRMGAMQGSNRYLGFDSFYVDLNIAKFLGSLAGIDQEPAWGATLESVRKLEPVDTRRPVIAAFHPLFQAALDSLRAVIEEIEQLGEIENDEYQPTVYAVTTASYLMADLCICSDQGILDPSIMPDGERGIIIEWERQANNGRRVARIIIVADETGRSYLYFRSNSGSDITYNLDGKTIAERLRWLTE